MASSLSPSDWPALSALLDEALALPAADRAQWLESLDAEHARHKETLRRLLMSADVETDAFLQTLPRLDDAGALHSTVEAGQLVGPYRLLRQVGAGGMGAVWLAERADGSLKRKVALKLPRLAWGGGLAGRLERERDILASLEHPHIARLYDAGVDQHGRPYLALEYVEGQPIDEYCDKCRLTIRERLRLMLQVASAVSFAHSRLVVHRDLKPSNILVTDDGQVRLLDFGIAKLLAIEGDADAGALTAALGVGLTLNYASPEQIKGGPLTTATDQYSLAVVIYELLCGTRPFARRREAGIGLASIIVESDAPSLSRQPIDADTAAARLTTPAALKRELAGDLDAVTMRALSRSAAERYASLDAFAEDLRRWLEGMPVATKPPRALYVAVKLITRHRIPALVIALSLVAVLTASVAAVFFGVQAREDSQRAQASRDFLLGLFRRADPYNQQGQEVTARDLLRFGETELARLSVDPKLRREMMQTLSNLWFHFSDHEVAASIQKRISEDLLDAGDKDALLESLLFEAEIAVAAEHWSRAREVLEASDALGPKERWSRRSLVRWNVQNGWVSLNEGRHDSARQLFQTASALAVNSEDLELQALALWGQAESLYRGGASDSAIDVLKRADQLLRDTPSDHARARSYVLHALVDVLYISGRYREGIIQVEHLLREVASLYENDSVQVKQRLVWLRYCLKLNEIARATTWLRSNQPSDESLARYGPSVRTQWYAVVGRIWAAGGDRGRALASLRQAHSTKDASDGLLRVQLLEHVLLAEARINLALLDYEAALSSLRSPEWERIAAAGLQESPYRSWLEAVALAELGELEEARAKFAAALANRNTYDRTEEALLKLNIAITLLRSKSAIPSEVEARLVSLPSTLTTTLGSQHRATRTSMLLANLLQRWKGGSIAANSSRDFSDVQTLELLKTERLFF